MRLPCPDYLLTIYVLCVLLNVVGKHLGILFILIILVWLNV